MEFNRRSIRLKEFDYTTPWWYYVTICTDERKYSFGRIRNGKMELNLFGKIADECRQNIPAHFPQTEIDYYVIMPNHVHGIIIINGRGTACRALTNTYCIVLFFFYISVFCVINLIPWRLVT